VSIVTFMDPSAPVRHRMLTVPVSSTWMLRASVAGYACQVGIVARLVHERPAIELPPPRPLRAVVVGLRPTPEHVDVHHVDTAEPALFDGALEKLQRRILPVLLHYEEVDASVIAGPHHVLAVLQADSHGLLGHHVAACLRDPHRLVRVQAARRRQHDDVSIGTGEQLVERSKAGSASALDCGAQGR